MARLPNLVVVMSRHSDAHNEVQNPNVGIDHTALPYLPKPHWVASPP